VVGNLSVCNSNKKKFYSSIDGLRAISFILVFLFHYSVPGFELGWGGVSVFFVISGFLITEILINSKQNCRYFTNFYVRRALRIIPIYIAFLVSVVLFILYRSGKLPSDLLYYLTYTQNIYQVFNVNPSGFSLRASSLLSHTWTLAIEEQFYLLWPLIIYLTPIRLLPAVSSAVVIIGVVFRLVAVLITQNYLVVSILLFSQIDLLALGSILAIYKTGHFDIDIRKYVKWAGFIGVLGIISVVFYIAVKYGVSLLVAYSYFKQPEFYALDLFTVNIYIFIGLVSIALIYSCVFRSNNYFFNRILSNKYITHIGKISYGLYLYHWPVYILLSGRFNNRFLFVLVGAVATYTISVLSYYYFERRINKYKNLFE
jgi:peptidoglycan/LPS O-acetylase OafA/YrhL